MDMVVSETLRKWPIVVIIDRVCTKPYTIEVKYPDEKPVHFKVGPPIFGPVFAIHRDPNYYPEPERFDPGRFNDQNKRKIKPYTYLPLGKGPRECTALRLGLLEAKTLFFYILSSFKIAAVEKSPIPLKITKKRMTMYAEGRFKCRTRT